MKTSITDFIKILQSQVENSPEFDYIGVLDNLSSLLPKDIRAKYDILIDTEIQKFDNDEYDDVIEVINGILDKLAQ